MQTSQQSELILSLHSSIQHCLTAFRLLGSSPPTLKADSLLQYAQMLDKLLLRLLTQIPVKIEELQADRIQAKLQLQAFAEEKELIMKQLKGLEDRLNEVENREKLLKAQYSVMVKSNQNYRNQVKSLKKSGEQGVREALQIKREGAGRVSLPRLDKRERMSLLWLMGPSIRTDKLAEHIIPHR